MIKLYPAISGAFKHELLGYFDTILFHNAMTDSSGTKFWCDLGSNSRIIALDLLNLENGAVLPCQMIINT